ncbi:MAG: P22 phage major capsid protein family protein [Gammaproteobacteria bacterium]
MPTNSLLSIDMITRELMFQLENNLTFTKYVNRNYDDTFARTGAKIGDTVTIRLPPLFTGRVGRVVNIEALQEQSVALTLDRQFGVDLDFSSKDLELTIDDFSARFLRSAAATIANDIDFQGLSEYINVHNAVGTPGTIPNALLTYLDAAALLDEEAVPRDGMRSNIVDPRMQSSIVNALSGLFHSSSEIERQYEEGTMGMNSGFKWSMDQNINKHTVGPQGGTPLVNGASQTGSSLITDGWTAAAAVRLNRGDVITLAGVNAVNPRSKQDTGQLRQFVVTAQASSDGSGNATLSIDPPITTSGAYQTVTASPANNAAITVLGAAGIVSPQGLAFHRDAFVLGMADLPLPRGTHEAARISDEQLGVSVRMIWDYDPVNDLFICRTDVLYGWVTARPELAVRVAA